MTGFWLFAQQVWDYYPEGSDPHRLWLFFNQNQKKAYKIAAKEGGPTPKLQKPYYIGPRINTFYSLIENPTGPIHYPSKIDNPAFTGTEEFSKFRQELEEEFPLITYNQLKSVFLNPEEKQSLKIYFQPRWERERDEGRSHALREIWNTVESERALGIGTDWDELSHFVELWTDWVP